jgi:hypothetical protein
MHSLLGSPQVATWVSNVLSGQAMALSMHCTVKLHLLSAYIPEHPVTE